MTQQDVCILGGGLAGLTLALQIHRRDPGLAITVVEHRRFPMPEAAHKVGESTVEIAAHYLAEQLGLRHHLEQAHLPKFGLRMFFSGTEAPTDLGRFDEIGASRVLPVPTYQVDRGTLENHLAEELGRRGVAVRDGVTVDRLELCAGDHRVGLGGAEGPTEIRTRYLVDASGRRALLRNRLGLGRPTMHHNAAVWFRVPQPVQIDTWSNDPAWRARCPDTPRRLSTNHFMGPGYWLWLIPLRGGATSVGLVFDPDLVSAEQVGNHDRFCRWLAAEQPLAASHLTDLPRMDFLKRGSYAVGSRRVFSADGWMMTGDAGMFSDPFYSPGSDFIAMNNTFITELVTGGMATPGLLEHYQQTYFAFFSSTLSIYRAQYPGFGDMDLMTLKSAWDYAYYWAVLAKLFFSGRMTDVAFMNAMKRDLLRAASMNARLQSRFRARARQRLCIGGEGRLVDHYRVPWFHALKQDLLDGAPEQAERALAANIEQLGVVARSLEQHMTRIESGQRAAGLDQVAGFA